MRGGHGRLALVMSLALAPCVITAAPASARYLEYVGIPGLRIMGSAIWHIDPSRSPVGGLDVLPQFTLLSLDDGWRAAVVAGYAFEGGGDTHFFQAGLEAGLLLSWEFGLDVGIRGLLGSSDGELGGGLRAVLGAELYLGIVRVEAAYQLVRSSRGVEHDLRVGAGVDLLRLIVVLAI